MAFAYKNNSVRIVLSAVFFGSLIGFLVISAKAQRTVDQTLAVITDASGASELITLSDVRWQLALEPGAQIEDVRPDDVTRVLDLLIKQRLFSLEANRIPQAPPSDADISAEVRDILAQFSTPNEFESRLRKVGFSSVKDENFERMMADRVRIKKYIDFRFRSFVVVTPEEELKYFQEEFLPTFKKRFPGSPEPAFSAKRSQITQSLVERRVGESIEAFLDEAERSVEIIYLFDGN
jgi:hypothetical protein